MARASATKLPRTNHRHVGFLFTTTATTKKAPKRVLISWWEEVDSNHRSRRRQIYSLMHLATLQSARI